MADVVVVRDSEGKRIGYRLEITPGKTKTVYRIEVHQNGAESSDVWPTDSVLARERFLQRREQYPGADIRVIEETYVITRTEKPISPEELQRRAEAEKSSRK